MIFCLCCLWYTALNSRVPAYDVNQNVMFFCFFKAIICQNSWSLQNLENHVSRPMSEMSQGIFGARD